MLDIHLDSPPNPEVAVKSDGGHGACAGRDARLTREVQRRAFMCAFRLAQCERAESHVAASCGIADLTVATRR